MGVLSLCWGSGGVCDVHNLYIYLLTRYSFICTCYGLISDFHVNFAGSAPDIAGKGIVNPVSILRTTQMMMEHLGAHTHK